MAESDKGFRVKAVEVSPYALLRVAPLPHRMLRDMAFETTWEEIGLARAAQDELASLGSEVVDEIHGLIPTITDSQLRRALLGIKRAAHQACADISPVILQTVRDAMPTLTRLVKLASWLDLVRDKQQANERAAAAGLRDIDARTRRTMRAALAYPSFSYALALSAPRLFEKVVIHHDFNDGKPRTNKSERSLMNYLGRAAAKTSPLSTFMFNAWVGTGVGRGWSDLCFTSAFDYVPETDVTRGAVARLARFARRDSHCYDQPMLAPNLSLSWTGDGRVQAIASTYIELVGRSWRQERLARFVLPENVQAILKDFTSPVRQDLLAERFLAAHYSAKDSQKWIMQLLSRGLILSAPLWHAHDGSPLPALIASLRQEGNTLAAPVVDQLAALQDRIVRIGTADAHSALRLHAEVNTLIDRAQSLVGARFSKPFQSNLSQNVAVSGVEGGLGPQFDTLVKELGTELAKHVAVSNEYRVILDLFKCAFGVGGRCDNLLKFLMDSFSAFSEACAQPPTTSDIVSDAVLGVTAYVQIITPDMQTLDAGRAHLVANLIYERAGWQAARYLPRQDGAPGNATWMMAAWLRNLAGNAEPVEMTFSGENNCLQAHCAVTERVLAWPCEGRGIERGADAGAIDPRQVSVIHDVLTNRLRFFAPCGKEIALMYLGGVMPTGSWGISSMLIRMAEPLTIRRPNHLFNRPMLGQEVVHQPRIAHGRVTLYRASWQIRASTLTELLALKDHVAQMRALEAFFREHSIPRISYVNAEVDHSAIESQRLNLDRLRKPTWFDVANPLCLDLLQRLCGQAQKLTFREALPGADETWLDIGGEKHTAEIQVEIKIKVCAV